jgi:peroxiredoxin
MLGQAMSFYWVLGLALQALQGLLARSVAVGDRDGVLVASWLVGYLCQ